MNTKELKNKEQEKETGLSELSSGRAKLFTGVIMMAMANKGLAIVGRSEKIAGVVVPVVGYLPRVSGGTGVQLSNAYAVGSHVLCASLSDDRVCYIIAPLAVTGSMHESFGQSLLYTIGQRIMVEHDINEDFDEHIKTIFKNTHAARHGVDADELPGDLDMGDRLGLAGLHVGRLLACIRGSSLAFVDCSNIDHKVRAVGNILEAHTPTFEKAIYNHQEQLGQLMAENHAMCIREACGFIQNSAEEDGRGLALNSDMRIQPIIEQRPFYREQHLSGAAIGGMVDEMLIPQHPGGTPVSVHTEETEPVVVAANRKSYSGAQTLSSAHKMLLYKSPEALGIVQGPYGGGAYVDPQRVLDGETLPRELRERITVGDVDFDPDDPGLPPWVKDNDELEADDSALYTNVENNLAEDYNRDVQTKTAPKAGVMVTRKPGTLAGTLGWVRDPRGGITNDPSYKMPQVQKIKEPITGKERKYFDSDSFVSMREDGTIVIADGYGSEIRMSRGNIYIAAALDVIVQPGRDYVNMTPRNLVNNSQGTITNNSKGSIYSSAQKSIRMVSAVGGTGTIMLENRATPSGGTATGIIISSTKDVSVTGNNLYIGRNSNKGAKEKGVTEPELSGSVFIDAGKNGVLHTRAAASCYEAREVTITADSTGSASTISVTPSMITLATSFVDIFGDTRIQSPNGTTESAVLSIDGDDETRPINCSAGALIVDGSIVCDILGADTGMVARKCMIAEGGATRTGRLGALPEAVNFDNEKWVPEPDSTSYTFAKSVVRSIAKESSGAFCDAHITKNTFEFPDYKVSLDLRLPGTRWQNVEGVEYGDMWEEREVPNVGPNGDPNRTMCYPGKQVWDSAKISLYWEEDGNLKSEYKTNTKHED